MRNALLAVFLAIALTACSSQTVKSPDGYVLHSSTSLGYDDPTVAASADYIAHQGPATARYIDAEARGLDAFYSQYKNNRSAIEAELIAESGKRAPNDILVHVVDERIVEELKKDKPDYQKIAALRKMRDEETRNSRDATRIKILQDMLNQCGSGDGDIGYVGSNSRVGNTSRTGSSQPASVNRNGPRVDPMLGPGATNPLSSRCPGHPDQGPGRHNLAVFNNSNYHMRFRCISESPGITFNEEIRIPAKSHRVFVVKPGIYSVHGCPDRPEGFNNRTFCVAYFNVDDIKGNAQWAGETFDACVPDNLSSMP